MDTHEREKAMVGEYFYFFIAELLATGGPEEDSEVLLGSRLLCEHLLFQEQDQSLG